MAFYKPNPICIPHHISLQKHTFRTYHLHWSHNTFYFDLALCDTNWLFHYNKRPTCQLWWWVQENHYRPRCQIWWTIWKTATYLVTLDQIILHQGFNKPRLSKQKYLPSQHVIINTSRKWATTTKSASRLKYIKHKLNQQ